MIGLGQFSGGSFFSRAIGVSADGATIVGSSNGAAGQEAFRWTTDDGMVGLGDLSGGDFFSIALEVSADGSSIVGFSNSASGYEVFVWDAANGMRELDTVLTDLGLDLSGWQLTKAWDLSADGRVIIGEGINPSGNTEAWLAMIPEPSTGLLLAVGLDGVVFRQRRGYCSNSTEGGTMKTARTAP